MTGFEDGGDRVSPPLQARPRRHCLGPERVPLPFSATSLPAHLSFVNGAERSRALHTSLKRDLSHGSEPGKPNSRARLRDLDLAWLRTRSCRSALACGRARNLDGIGGHAPRQAWPTKEAPVDHQDTRASRLISQMLGDSPVSFPRLSSTARRGDVR
jgi:hypothetical protein